MIIRLFHEPNAGRYAMGPIERVAVIGAGNMGSGIAQKSAQEGFSVQMVDKEEVEMILQLFQMNFLVLLMAQVVKVVMV